MTTRQKIEGQMHRTLSATFAIRQLEDGKTDDGLLRLRMSVASETPYLRRSWFDDPWVETLGHKDGEVNLTRLNDGAPLLANHDRFTSHGKTPLAGIGAVEKAWTEGDQLITNIVVSRRDALADFRKDIEDNLVRNVSVGYIIDERILTKASSGGLPAEYRVTSWTPYEVSFADVPADATVGLGRSIDGDSKNPTAQYRVVDLPALGLTLQKGDITMPLSNEAAATEAVRTPEVIAREVVRTQETVPVVKAPSASVSAIREAVRVAGFDFGVALDFIERALSIDAVRTELFARMAEKTNQSPQRSGHSNIVTIRDEGVLRRDMIAESVAHRIAPSSKLSDGAREYRHMSLLDLAKECLANANQSFRGLSGMEIAARALHSTTDFPLILAAVANKRLADAYTGANTTYALWAKRAPNAPDFKTINVVSITGAPDLLPVGVGGEFKYGTISEGAETYKVATYGRLIAFTRQAIVNDDLRAFDRVVSSFASSAKRLENRLVYAQLTANANLADGYALFGTDHANLAGTPAVITSENLAIGRKAIRLQKGGQGEELNIVPRFLIVPTALEQVAYRYTSSQYVPAKPSDTNEFRTGGRTALEPIVEAVLDADSSTAWYLAGDGSDADTVEYCWLDGSEGVYMDSEPGFDIDGMKMKARLDFATKVVDYRGLWKNAGA